ncbi:hypothetical protein V1515DRAFT_518024, partial [Lipomyces mesembrius]
YLLSYTNLAKSWDCRAEERLAFTKPMAFHEQAIAQLLSASSTIGHGSLAHGFGNATAIYFTLFCRISLFVLVITGKLVSRHNHKSTFPYTVSMGTANAW